MGVGIDCIVQAKIDGTWTTVLDDYYIVRGYGIYWWLGYESRPQPEPNPGRVEDRIVPIARSRGFPDDYRRNDKELGCAPYDRSWLTAEEILAAPLPAFEEREPAALDPTPRWLRGDRASPCNVAAVRADLRQWQAKYGEVRLVFGFE